MHTHVFLSDMCIDFIWPDEHPFFFFYFQYVQNFINQTWMDRYQSNISDHVLTLLWSTIVSIFTLGGFVGAIIGGTLSVKLGR